MSLGVVQQYSSELPDIVTTENSVVRQKQKMYCTHVIQCYCIKNVDMFTFFFIKPPVHFFNLLIIVIF